MKRRFFLQGMGAAVLASVPTSVFSVVGSKAKGKKAVFSVMDVFESNAMRDQVRQRVANFDAAVYINEAVSYSLRRGYKAVYIPSGTYLLSGKRTGIYDAILFARSNLTVLGDGQDSILKVADNYTDGGDYRVLAPIAEEEVNNFSVRNIHFDGNAKHNLVLGSFEKKHIRRAYSINILSGNNIYIEDCLFTNNPGRGVINLGNNASFPSMSNVVIQSNVIANVGGSIKGNRPQNDHSSIYLQADVAIVTKNRFYNDFSTDPYISPAVTVVALEIHGRNTKIISNFVKNYTNGGNAVATVQTSDNNQWLNNSFVNLTGLGLTLWCIFPFENKNLLIKNNVFHVDNSIYSGNTAIYQNPSSQVTTNSIKKMKIMQNFIYSDVVQSRKYTWHGISLCAIEDCIISENTIKNIQGCAVNIDNADSFLMVKNLSVVNNKFENIGLHLAKTRIWSIRVFSERSGYDFSGIYINNNIFLKANGGEMRGVLVKGKKIDYYIGTGNKFSNIDEKYKVQL